MSLQPTKSSHLCVSHKLSDSQAVHVLYVSTYVSPCGHESSRTGAANSQSGRFMNMPTSFVAMKVLVACCSHE